MASGSDGLAAQANSGSDLPRFDDVFDSESWEARLSRARKKREAAKASAAHPDLPDVVRDHSAKATEGASQVSLKEVLGTGNLKDRLELAEMRNAQVKKSREGNSAMPDFAFSRKSTAEFKKVVLYAKSGDPVAEVGKHRSNGEGAQVLAKPLGQKESQREGQASGKHHRGAIAAALAIGLFSGTAGALWISQEPELSVSLTPSVDQADAPTVADQALPTNPEPQALALVSTSDGEELAGTGTLNQQLPFDSPSPLSGFTDVGYQPEIGFSPGETDQTVFLSTRSFSTPDRATHVPEQPNFLGGVENSVLLSALKLPGAQVSTSADTKSGIDSFQVNAGPVSIDWVSPKAPIETEIGRPQLLAELAVPASMKNIKPVFGDVPLVSLLALAPTKLGAVTFDLPPSIGVSEPYSAVWTLPVLPAGQGGTGDLPDVGNAPEPLVLASLTTGPMIDESAQVVSNLPFHSIRVFAPADLAEAETASVVAAVGEAGFDVGSLKAVGFSISKSNIRFYHREDEATALALASVTDAKARDFTDFSPRPPAGTVELWLAGSAPKARTPRRQRTPTRTSDSDPNLQALRDRLVQQLRSGDHLGGN